MDTFDRVCIIVFVLCLLALSAGAMCLATDLAKRVEVLEQAAVEAKP